MSLAPVATLSAPRVPTNLPVHTFNTRRCQYVAYDLVGYLVLRSVLTGTTGTNTSRGSLDNEEGISLETRQIHTCMYPTAICSSIMMKMETSQGAAVPDAE